MIEVDKVLEIQNILKDKVVQSARDPEFHRPDEAGEAPYRIDPDGSPAVRVAMANAALDTDIWTGLLSPAAVGQYPIGFREIWDFYAANTVQNTRRDGSPNLLAIPDTFEEAKKRFSRAAIVSALLPLAPRIFKRYNRVLDDGGMEYADRYCRAAKDADDILSKAIAKLSLDLVAKTRAVVCMNPDGVDKVAAFTRSKSQSDDFHGPCNNPFPQLSVAVLTGLMQFGVNRIPFRDERDSEGRVHRLMGHYASIVFFDDKPLTTDGAGGVEFIDPAYLADASRLADFTDTDPEAVERRYCPYNRTDEATGHSICGECIQACPSGAVANSSPRPDGSFPESIRSQKHRFHGGFLDFDHGNCYQFRKQRKNLYSEYACARCLVVCAAKGVSGIGPRGDLDD